MDLELINNEYVQFKKDLEETKELIGSIEDQVNYLADDKVVQHAEAINAKRNGDELAEQKAKEEVAKIEEKIKRLKEIALNKQENLKEIQAKINDRIEQIKQNPEMKEHLNDVMSKRYERKISKLEVEKEEALKEKGRLTDLKQLLTAHPALANNLKGILVATKEIKDLQSELKGLVLTTIGDSNTGAVQYKDPARASEIMTRLLPEAKDKLEKNKTPLMGYISKHGLNITEEDIDGIADKGFVVTGKNKDQVDLDATLNKSISRVNRQIKGYDKNIRNHQIAIQNINGQSHIQQPAQPGHTVIQPPLPAVSSNKKEEVKWYQFIKRFRNWYDNRKNNATAAQQQTQPTAPIGSNSNNQFRDSLKYEIVRDVEKEVREGKVKEAKQQRKDEDRNI